MDLISSKYLELNRQMHEAPEGFGGSGYKELERVLRFASNVKARSILDYGCGEGTLKKALIKAGWKGTITEYDPAVRGKSKLPKPADLVVCTDVLEHVEPDCLDNVLVHLKSLTIKACYAVIATRPANKLLPTGQNAHLIIEDTPWWLDRLHASGWKTEGSVDIRKPDGRPHVVRVWLRP